MNDLTKQQEKILNTIIKITQENGYSPSIREIGEEAGLSSPSTVYNHIKNLEKKGYIKKRPGKSRGIELIKNDKSANHIDDIASVPILGKVVAGYPVLSYENYEDTVTIPKYMLKGNNPENFFLLYVNGESMSKVGINHDDLLLIKKQSQANNNEIVVALVDDEETTVKRFIIHDDKIELRPENDLFESIYSNHVTILGIVYGLLRTY
jgi:repressor LexA